MQLSILKTTLISSLGSFPEAYGAYRAGINRFTESKIAKTFTPGDEEPTGITVAPLPDYFGAYQRNGRFKRMFSQAVKPLLDTINQLGIAADSLGVYCAVPDPWHRNLIDLDNNLVDLSESARSLLHFTPLFQQALVDMGVAVPEDNIYCYGFDQTAFICTLERASIYMADKQQDYALIVALDSLTEPATIDQQLQLDKIKSPDNPVGYIPGEAAVAFLVSRHTNTGTALDIQLAYEDDSYGKEPYEALATLLDIQGWAPPSQHPLAYYNDTDGEVWRGQQWGNLQAQLCNGPWHIDQQQVQVPAKAFANTGAATGALAFALAIEQHQQGHSSHPAFMLLNFRSQDANNPSYGCLLARHITMTGSK